MSKKQKHRARTQKRNARKRKRDEQRRRRPKSSSEKPKRQFTRFAVEAEHHASLRKAAIEAAKKSVESFPDTLADLNKTLRANDPFSLLASVAGYGLITMASEAEGVSPTSVLNDRVSQYHVEMLQALVLAVPTTELTSSPHTAKEMEDVFAVLPKLTDTFLHQRILAAEADEDTVASTLQSLQERMRLHTQAVRNWGYYSEVVRITSELFSPLDSGLQKHFGFGASDLIRVVSVVVDELERRYSEHWDTLRNVLKERTVQRLAEAYYEQVPSLVGDAQQLLDSLPSEITPRGMISCIMQHYDLRMIDVATFRSDQVAALTGLSEEVVSAALRAISKTPGSLEAVDTDYLFLGNPVWDAPGIDLGDAFLLPMPQMFFSHVHRIMERLAAEAGMKTDLEFRRSEYLEDQLSKIFTASLPGATITCSAKWELSGEQFETDLLVVIDRTVVIAEAKSNRLTPSGLRGAPDRVKRHVRDLVIYPSTQSARLEKLLRDAAEGDQTAVTVANDLGIDPTKVDQVIRVSVTLEDFSVLSSAETEFKSIGWIPQDHKLAPAVLFADLLCIAEVLDSPLLFLHYLSERIHLQKSFDLLGDELDFLGLYLESGFNIAGMREDNLLFSPSGMSEPIDRFYMSRDAGIQLPKPKVELSSLFAQTVEKLEVRKSSGWTTAGLHLLSVADPAEQKQIESKLTKLRKFVRKNFGDPSHLSSLCVRPPEDRKALVVFFLFEESQRVLSKAAMEQHADQALAEHADINTVVVFGRSTEVWNEPYEAVIVATRNDAQKPSSGE